MAKMKMNNKMRQSITTTLFAVLLSMVVINAFAHDIAVTNSDDVTIYYNWIKNNTELSVSYQGSSYSDYSNEYTGSIVIPSSVVYQGNTYRVTSIGSSAFSGCSGLTSIMVEGGIGCKGKTARQMTRRDYDRFDLLIGMDSANIRNMYRICGGDPEQKIYEFLDFTDRIGDVADPWYTGDFEATWRDVLEGCQCLLEQLTPAT